MQFPPAGRWRSPVNSLAAILSSAILLTASQLWIYLGWLSLVGLAPVCLMLKPWSLRSTLLHLAPTYFLITAFSMHWIARYNGGRMGWAVVLTAIYAACWIIVPALACRLIRAGPGRVDGLLVLPAAWTLMELLSRRSPVGLSWLLAGLPLADWRWTAQIATLAGPEAVSFLAVGISTSLVVFARPAERLPRIFALLQGPALLAVITLYGAMRPAPPNTEPVWKIAVIQPNVRWSGSVEVESLETVLASYDRLIEELEPESYDMVVLPESALYGLVRFDDQLTAWARATVIRTRKPLIFGTLDRAEDESIRIHNVAILITPYNTVQTYSKMRLVPVGEFTPRVGPLGPIISRLREGLLEYSPGAAPEIFELVGLGRAGVLICYEDVFPDLARAYAQHDVDVLIAVINTESFDATAQPLQHLRRARLTSIATGLPMVRASNSGVSCLIASDGRIVDKIADASGRSVAVAGARVFRVNGRGRPTPYRRAGDMGSIVVCLAYLGGFALWARFRPRKRSVDIHDDCDSVQP